MLVGLAVNVARGVQVGYGVVVGRGVRVGVIVGASTAVGVISASGGYNSNIALYQSKSPAETNSLKRAPG